MRRRNSTFLPYNRYSKSSLCVV